MESKSKANILLPLYPLVKPVIELTANTTDDVAPILSGKKGLDVDITADLLKRVKAGNTLKLTLLTAWTAYLADY